VQAQPCAALGAHCVFAREIAEIRAEVGSAARRLSQGRSLQSVERAQQRARNELGVEPSSAAKLTFVSGRKRIEGAQTLVNSAAQESAGSAAGQQSAVTKLPIQSDFRYCAKSAIC
jgi:hypothetical protein